MDIYLSEHITTLYLIIFTHIDINKCIKVDCLSYVSSATLYLLLVSVSSVLANFYPRSFPVKLCKFFNNFFIIARGAACHLNLYNENKNKQTKKKNKQTKTHPHEYMCLVPTTHDYM